VHTFDHQSQQAIRFLPPVVLMTRVGNQNISREETAGRPTANVVDLATTRPSSRPPAERNLIACCDLMVEGVHFRTEWTSPRLLGRKALAVNFSDVAAMGGIRSRDDEYSSASQLLLGIHR